MSECPKIVTLGGGTGQFALLSGLKQCHADVTAVVAMSDDGGSTGVLRDELGVLPPGDVRQCLVALSEADATLRALFTHRFDRGSLKGHTFGNLFLSALEHVSGSLDRAIAEAGHILKISGTVLPVTHTKTRLTMTLGNGKVLEGEHAIASYLLISKFGVASMALTPEAELGSAVRCAVEAADLIVLGPGSLYSSLVPVLLTRGLPEVLARARAPKVFVANLMNTYGHTDGFTCSRYVEELERLAGMSFIDRVLYNTVPPAPELVARYVDEGEPVSCVSTATGRVRYVGADLLADAVAHPAPGDPLRRTLIRHDPDKLARAVLSLL